MQHYRLPIIEGIVPELVRARTETWIGIGIGMMFSGLGWVECACWQSHCACVGEAE